MKKEKKKTEVLIHAKIIDSATRDQIKIISESPALYGLIAIMPDCHKGIGSCIGFTGKFNNAVIANLVGTDIGCGVTAYPLGKIDIDFEELDEHIRNVVPLGFNSHEDEKFLKDLEPHHKKIVNDKCDEIVKKFYTNRYKDYISPILQIGTLGGGNHFIEINIDELTGEKFLTIHSGSRNLGQKIANFYQTKAKQFHIAMPENRPVRDLEWLPLEYGGKDYLNSLYLAQEYASINRQVIITRILKFFNMRYIDSLKIESVHNYISPRDNIIRKGAISAHKGEQVIIPLNMRDGSVIGIGKGNSSYNYSAPHGAGRVFGRNQMKEQLRNGEVTMEQFKYEMKDVFSTSVCQGTIDESPFAYKSFDDIKEYLEETVEIQKIIKPIYNLKSD